MNYYNEIKNELINNEINKQVKKYSINRSDLNTYYNVGKLLFNAGNCYGEGIIKEYSKKLFCELNIKYDVSSLNKMRKFYILIEKVATLSPNLTYSHYVELLPYEDLNKINQDKTIGIIICKQDNKYVIKYCSDKRIITREYELV